MTVHDGTVFRASPVLLIAAVIGLLTPSTITALIPVSGQRLAPDMIVLLILLWLMMLAAAVPLFLLWRRARVRIDATRVEIRNLGAVRSVIIEDIASIERTPDKLVLRGRDGRPIGSITRFMSGFPRLCDQIAERVGEAAENDRP